MSSESDTSTNPTDTTGPSIDENDDRSERTRQDDGSFLDSIRTTFNALGRDQQIVVVGGVLAFVGSLLPWASAFGVTVLGVNGDGLLALIAGVVAAWAAYSEPLDGTTKNLYAAAALGGFIVLLGIASLTGISGIGVYITIIGGLLVAYPGVSTALTNYERSG